MAKFIVHTDNGYKSSTEIEAEYFEFKDGRLVLTSRDLGMVAAFNHWEHIEMVVEVNEVA